MAQEPKIEVRQEEIDNEISEVRKLLDDISGNVEARFMSNASAEERQEILRGVKFIKAEARRMLKTVETPHVE